MKGEPMVEVNITSLCGAPKRVADDLRRLADEVERGERYQSSAAACVVSVGAPGQWDQKVTNADVAREFFRRFGPVKVLVGAWGEGRLAYAEEDGGEWLSGVSSGDSQTEEHAAGDDGFVAALERARALVKGGDR